MENGYVIPTPAHSEVRKTDVPSTGEKTHHWVVRDLKVKKLVPKLRGALVWSLCGYHGV